jgi:hypothetical protein
LKKDLQSCVRVRGFKNAKSAIPMSGGLNRLKQSRLPERALSSGQEEMRTIDSFPSKSTIGIFSGKSPLKSQTSPDGGLLPHDAPFLGQKDNSPSMVSESLMKKESAAEFPFVSMEKGRMLGHKADQFHGQEGLWHSKETRRLSYVERLKLFQALSKEPLSFLDLHGRFGVSKQTIKRLVKNGFLKEVWGCNAIGVEFKLTNKSRNHLKKLKATAKRGLTITEKNLIRLKQRI